jgi:hypothetical protein
MSWTGLGVESLILVIWVCLQPSPTTTASQLTCSTTPTGFEPLSSPGMTPPLFVYCRAAGQPVGRAHRSAHRSRCRTMPTTHCLATEPLR